MKKLSIEQYHNLYEMNDLLTLGREYELSAYDASYLALAISEELPIATLDKQLLKACNQTKVEVILSPDHINL